MTVWRSDPDLAARFHPRYPDHLEVMLHDGEPRRTGRQPEACWVEVTALHARVRFPNIAREAGGGGDRRVAAQVKGDHVYWIERSVYRATLLHATQALTTIGEGQSLVFLVVPGIPYPLQVDQPYLTERVRWVVRPCDRCGADQVLDSPSTLARTRFGDHDGSPMCFTMHCPCGGSMELLLLAFLEEVKRSRVSTPQPRLPARGRASPPPPPRPDGASASSAKPARTRWIWIPDPQQGRALAFTYVDRMAGPSAKGARVGDAPDEAAIRRAVDEPDITFRDPERFGAVPVSPEEALRLGLPKDPPWIGHFERKPIPPPRGAPSRVVTGRVLRDGAPVAGARVQMGYASGHARELLPLDERTTERDGSFAFPLAPMRDVAVIADIPGMSSRLLDVPAEGPIDLALEGLGAMAGHIQRAGAPVAAAVSLIGLDGGPLRVMYCRADGRYQLEGLVPGRYEVTVEALNRDRMTNGTPVVEHVDIVAGRTLARDFTVAAGTIVHVRVTLPPGGDSAHVYLMTGRLLVQRQSELRPLFHSPELRGANQLQTRGTLLTTEFLDVLPGEHTVCVIPWDRRSDGDRDPPVLSRIIIVASTPQTVDLALP